MEEKSTNRKIIIDAIVTSLISSVIVFIINLSVSLITKEKVNITLTPSSYINNEYITVISIKNFQNNKSISEINLWFDNVIIKNASTELKNETTSNNIKLNNIVPDYIGNIIIYSEKEINEHNLKVEANEKYNLVFTSSQQESAYIDIKKYFGVACIYCIEFCIMLCLSEKYTNKKIKRAERTLEILKQSQDISEKNQKELNKRIMKNKLLLEKKISDYSKELNFWKDTIRKILYGVSKEEMKKKDICEIVTNNLKTYRTREKCQYSELEDIIEEFKEEKSKE